MSRQLGPQLDFFISRPFSELTWARRRDELQLVRNFGCLDRTGSWTLLPSSLWSVVFVHSPEP